MTAKVNNLKNMEGDPGSSDLIALPVSDQVNETRTQLSIVTNNEEKKSILEVGELLFKDDNKDIKNQRIGRFQALYGFVQKWSSEKQEVIKISPEYIQSRRKYNSLDLSDRDDLKIIMMAYARVLQEEKEDSKNESNTPVNNLKEIEKEVVEPQAEGQEQEKAIKEGLIDENEARLSELKIANEEVVFMPGKVDGQGKEFLNKLFGETLTDKEKQDILSSNHPNITYKLDDVLSRIKDGKKINWEKYNMIMQYMLTVPKNLDSVIEIINHIEKPLEKSWWNKIF